MAVGSDDRVWRSDAGYAVSFSKAAAVSESLSGGRSDGGALDGWNFALCIAERVCGSSDDLGRYFHDA